MQRTHLFKDSPLLCAGRCVLPSQALLPRLFFACRLFNSGLFHFIFARCAAASVAVAPNQPASRQQENKKTLPGHRYLLHPQKFAAELINAVCCCVESAEWCLSIGPPPPAKKKKKKRVPQLCSGCGLLSLVQHITENIQSCAVKIGTTPSYSL